jgi:hypothetical protein
MLRDNLVGLIEPMFNNAGAHASVVAQNRKWGMLQVDRAGNHRSEAILGTKFFAGKRPTGRKNENGRFCSKH